MTIRSQMPPNSDLLSKYTRSTGNILLTLKKAEHLIRCLRVEGGKRVVNRIKASGSTEENHRRGKTLHF